MLSARHAAPPARSRRTLLVAFASIMAAPLSSCGGNPTTSPPDTNGLSSAKALLSFGIPKAANGTSVDADVRMSGTTVTAFLPPGTSRVALKPTFTVSAGASVLVNNQVQTSGSSAVNFTNPVTFVIRAEDGSTTNYSVTLITDIATIDNVMTGFMATYGVPGLALAITKDENLVYLKAYGKSDDTHALTTSNLFRLASLSKSITAVAIMKLMDQGKISPSDKVFGTGAILGTTYGTTPYGPGVTNITVDQLMHHTSGGWPNDGSDGTDPMFTNSTMTAAQLISWTLDNRPLKFTPGTTYSYSNFGYCVLGRVIEKVTGQSYYDAVTSLVLAPAGITTMRIGGNALGDRLPSEVQYYGQGGENPYLYNIARMDAHGGWVASASDLAKFLVRIDGKSGKPDILSASAIATMTTGSSANSNYADGWSVNGPNWWHLGSLPGTATEHARTTSKGNYNFVILVNTRSSSSAFLGDMDQLFWKALAATAVWPTYDLFPAVP